MKLPFPRLLGILAILSIESLADCAAGTHSALPGDFIGSSVITQSAQPGSKPIFGVYVTEYQLDMNAYNYQATGNPLCSYEGNKYLYNVKGSIQSDVNHELIVPQTPIGSIPGGVNIFKEPEHGCVPLAPEKIIPIYDAVDGFSPDGKTYYIARPREIAICKFGRRPGCPRSLPIPLPLYRIFSVTANASGVYAIATDSNNHPYLTFWQSAQGKGTILDLNEFANGAAGGIYVDGFGNLLTIDPSYNVLWVYSGCPNACATHGPFSWASGSGIVTYGSLNRDDSRFMVTDLGVLGIQVYQYNGTYGLTYLYSNGNCFYNRCSPLAIAQRL